ncbi:MAG: aminoacyl-tRNA hydrolase [Candidatus Omnitrophica bacterium]|nr:aminoacyl-tRNA hydrolase [Candidatus Omnitrophota bacterium]
MKYIIGLGNPGLEYRSTKHNVGFAAVKEFAKENKIKLKEKRYLALIGKGRVSGEDVALVLPQTYMNRSGDTVGDLVSNEIKSLDDLMIVCDDINLKLGRIRLKKQGSSGGHKGLESIIKELGRGDFQRLRIGIATGAHKGDITRYVLTPFKRREHKNASHAISLANDALACWIAKGMDEAMNRFNR